MNQNLRNSGIDIIGHVPWGTHFCQFYQTKEDLMDIIVPYFKAGLENNEFCMWVTSQPLDAEEAKEALRRAVPDLDVYLEKRQIEIIPYTQWYVKEGVFDSNRVLNGWVEKLNQALANGYDGLRLTGNTFWLEKEDWNDFVDYEEEVDRVLGNYQMIALCTYCLDKCNAKEIIDVVVNHQFALIKREGKWEQIESSKRKEAEKTAIQATKNWEYTFDSVPDLIAILDEEHRVVRANRAMAERLGVTPEECIGLNCYRVVHGMNEPPSFCPHSQLLADGLEHTTEVHEESLGGDFIVSVSPMHDSEGKIIGSAHVARDITERKRSEEALQRERNLLENVMQTTDVMLVFLDPQFNFVWVNPAYAETCQMKPEEMVGKNHFVLYPHEENEAIFRQVRDTGEGVFYKDKTFVFPDQPERGVTYWDWSLAPVKDAGGNVTGLVFSLRETTKYKQGEEALREAYESLQMQSEELQAQSEELHLQSEELQVQNEELQTQSEELHEAYEAVKKSERRYHLLFENMLDGFAYCKMLYDDRRHPVDFIYLDTNSAFEWLTGLKGVVGKRVTDVIPRIKESHPELFNIYGRVALTGQPERFEIEFKPLGIWLSVSVYSTEREYFIAVFDNITERKKVEETLRESEERFHTMANAMPQLAWIAEPDGYIYWYNERWYAYTGTTPEQMEGWGWQSVHDPEVLPKVLEQWKASIATGQMFDMEFPLRGADGIFRPFLTRVLPLKDANGNILQWFGTNTDVTERKKAEEALRESEARRKVAEVVEVERQRLFDVLETLPVNICLLTTDYHFTFCNRNFREKFGECSGQRCYELCFGYDKPCEFCESYKVLETCQPHHWECTCMDGSVIDVYDFPFTDIDGSPMILEMNIDITERKKAEEALKLSSIYNRSLIEASLDPLVTIGHDGSITDVNEATELVTGYSRDKLIGTDFMDYFTEPEKARKGYQEVFRERFVSDYALEIRHRNGRIVPVLYNASVYRDESGEVIGVFAAARDITELKKAEEILKTKLEELRRSNEELEQFAYVSSHDLQEPLRMISSYLQLLQRRYQGKIDEKADKYIYYAVDGAARMQTLINDLLEFSRVTTKAREPEPTDSEFVFNQVLSNLDLYVKQNRATISHDSLPEVVADNTQLAQVFQNLIINGIKFHSEKAPKVHISVEKKASEWLFSVRDNGIGIDPQYSEKIFEVFKRLHNKEEYPGTGIGLAICKKIVERHSGHIWVESEIGRGSIFYFTLPIN